MDLSFAGEDIKEVQVTSGKTIDLGTMNQCKYDLKVYTPVVQNGKVTLRWSAYPGGDYNAYFGDIYQNGPSIHHLESTSWTPDRDFSSGNYIYIVESHGNNGQCAVGIGRFTIP